MAKSKKKALIKAKESELKNSKPQKWEKDLEDNFDFGGLPKEVNLKKNIGCGG